VAWAYGAYLGSLPYDVAKAAIARMASSLAAELRPHHVASLAVAPGWIRTERLMAYAAANPLDISAAESPEYLGRAIAALATAPDLMARSGQAVTAGDTAREFGFTDTDGRQPEGFRIPEAS
jgi:NAD(P)-dependent dehydrogenase (short-subunit alcohol dehydrogenase family)